MQKGQHGFLYYVKLMVVAALLVLGVIYFRQLWTVVKNIYGILLPFLIGGIIAFVLNIPMRGIENFFFKKAKKKFWLKTKRSISMILTIIFVLLLCAILGFSVIPQMVVTIKDIALKVPDFYQGVLEEVQEWLNQYPQIKKMVADELVKLQNIKVDWPTVLTNVSDFFKNGLGGSFIKNTFNMAGKIGGGFYNAVIALIFSMYILSQKEKLEKQGRKILSAFLSDKHNKTILKVLGMLETNFSNFIAGQCLEAVILGSLVAVAMLIFKFDYVVLIGVLVAFTALIPVVGGFIGCGVGVLLIMIDDPIKALWFVVLFVIVQQIEGNFIYPYVVGNSVGLPSMWVLAAITVGGSLMGVGGMLFFIPLASTAYALLRESVNQKNAEKGIEYEEEQVEQKRRLPSFKFKKKEKLPKGKALAKNKETGPMKEEAVGTEFDDYQDDSDTNV